jgi:subtilisin family serine protease
VKRVVVFAAVFVYSVTLAPFHAPTTRALSEVPEPIARSFPTQTSGVPGFSSPNDGVPWGLDRIDQRTPISSVATQRSYTYSSGSTGAGVTVYVVDSGVQASHSDFGPRVANGWSYRANLNALNSYKTSRNDYDTDPEPNPDLKKGTPPCPATYNFGAGSPTYQRQFDPADFDAPEDPDTNDVAETDNDGHGTHVAGIVAGTLAGVAKDATIVPVRVLDSCGAGTTTMIRDGLTWILNRHTAGQKAVVNLSLGFASKVDVIDNLIIQMINKGMIVVAAAGNSATSSCNTTPAGTPGTFSIGATSTIFNTNNGLFFDRESFYSNFGDCVDMFAPGTQIASTWSHLQVQGSNATPNPFWPISGTSMAAPHVSGVLARYLQTVSLPLNANASVSANAWTWTQLHATCNAVTYHSNNRNTQTPNRLLAIEAPVSVPCMPRNLATTPAIESATVSWDAPVAHNGETPTYEVSLSPGGQSCSTSQTQCSFTGLLGNTQYVVSVNTRNSAGVSSAVVSTVTPIPSVTQLQLVPGDGSLVARWTAAVGPGVTFTAVVSPGDFRCVTTTTSCVFDGLLNDQTYSVTVTGENSVGASSVTGVVAPNGAPKVPTVVRISTGIGRATFRWSAISDSVNPTYVLSTSDGRHSCTTTATSCTIRGLPNGKLRTLYLTTRTAAGGESLTRTSVRVTAGFKVGTTTVRRSSRVALTSLVSPVSRGRVTWRSSPSCRVVGTRLVTPNRRATCELTVSVAKSGNTPAMSTRVKLAIR